MATRNRSALEEKLRGAAPKVAESTLSGIREFLDTAKDAALVNINPYRLAQTRGLGPLDTLKAMLHLTKSGVFNLFWNVHCPSCKGVTQASSKLASLRHGSACPFCEIGFEAGFDTGVEVSFGVNPAVIKPENTTPFAQLFASIDTEPGISIALEPGETHVLSVDLLPGNYLLVDAEREKVVNFPVSTSMGAAQVLDVGLKDNDELLRIVKARQGKAEIRFTNRAKRRRSLVFARQVAPLWASAALVSSLQEFRDMFSSEMLSPEETFSIANLAFLFTDIKGSTELYERLGDSQAFALVKEHFAIMERIVKAHDGGIVKTIGDAVMAAFVSPREALRSALEMIEAFDDMEIARKLKNSIVIKVGVHCGPCIAVTSNEKIDYFGTTVNIAARVQGLSDGRDVMASDQLFIDGEAAASIAARKWSFDTFSTSLKGLKDSYTIHKLVHAAH